MWTIRTNLHYIDNGVFVEMIAEPNHDPRDVPMMPPRAIRRVFTSQEDAIEFVMLTLKGGMSPKNITEEATVHMQPPSDLSH